MFATLRLRGRGGPIVTHLFRPDGPCSGLVIGVGLDAPAARALSRDCSSVVAVIRRSQPEVDVWTATQWLSDHLAELGIDGGPIMITGVGDGRTSAVTTAGRARETGWPEIVLMAAQPA